MKLRNRLLVLIFVSGFLFVVDQVLKYFARTNSEFVYYLWKPWIGWEYFGNSGVAFSLPLPNLLAVIFTPVILLGLIVWMVKLSAFSFQLAGKTEEQTTICKLKAVSCKLLAISLIIAGAISNYVDRVLFAVTIDYIRIFTGVFNLADVMILGGVIMLIVSNKEIKKLGN